MYKDKSVAVVIPCYNEALQIGKVVDNLPHYVDSIIIIDDKSKDDTVSVVKEKAKENKKIELLIHEVNQGVGGAIATGYKWTLQKDYDIIVVMDGDGQMAPEDLPAILEPVVSGEVDYSKGNRLFTGEAYRKIPKTRYFGNSVLSFLTKIASGYWHIADSQTGYRAITKKALQNIDIDRLYKRYGQPNDILINLNVYNFKVRDVPIKPVYNVGEKSSLKIRKVIFTISWLLLKRFLWRLKEKYVIRDFHPLVLFYLLGLFFTTTSFALSIRLVTLWIINGYVPSTTALAAMFSFMSGSQFTLFAMWFDMEANKNLK